MDLEGKVAIVTGAASGIGLSSARLFAREGAKVVLADIDVEQGQAAAEAVGRDGGDALFVPTDVADPAACERLVEAALGRYGRLDCACNNAGISGELHPLAEMSIANWDRVIMVNLSSVFYCMKYQIPAMLKSQGGGAIVNVSSILGRVGFANACAYAAAKHGVLGVTENAALEYGAQGIRANVVGPGFISTPMIAGLEQDPQTKAELVSRHPIGRLGRPEEVAELVVWLCSDKSSFVTGAYYPVDGGYLAR
ncbi:MAG TPA: SDR family oxidoreductase [Firmicutes bacterium]|nr:SDR family oxidoreductase [Bacillota bacterium]